VGPVGAFAIGFAAGAGPYLTAQPEVEPNDAAATATLLNLNGMRGMGAGAVAAGDADYWRIDNLPAGGRIWIYVDTGGTQNAGATSRDSTVTLYAADGTTERLAGAKRACELVRETWRAFEEFNLSPALAFEALFVRLRAELGVHVSAPV
jgi:hypothetical protein